MDLRNLLNQKEENRGLTLIELNELLEAGDSAKSVEKITNATFTFPSSKPESFAFFNIFIQLLLSVTHEEDPYGMQYTRSIIIDSLRTGINGLLNQFDMSWLLEFPQQLTAKTWNSLSRSADISILLYLYGFVLALSKNLDKINKTAWINGLVNFIQSDTHEIITHLWLSVCAIDDTRNQQEFKKTFLNALETRLKTQQPSAKKAQEQTLTLLKRKDTEYLATKVDQQLGSALARAPFTADEFMLGLLELERFSRLNQGLLYRAICASFMKIKRESGNQNGNVRMRRLTIKIDELMEHNPLLDHPLILASPSDDGHYAEGCLAECNRFWIRKMEDMIPDEFDACITILIKQHYPTEQKTNLDFVLADWAAKDKFGRHRYLIVDTILQLLKKTRYNNRTAPFYTFTKLFYLREEQLGDNRSFKKKRLGVDQKLVVGCLSILKRMTEVETETLGRVEAWVGDCLRVTEPDVSKRYIEWLCKANENNTNPRKKKMYLRFLDTALKETVNHLYHTVPIILRSFDDSMLTWLLKLSFTKEMMARYFGGVAQWSTHNLVCDLLSNKSKEFMVKLLTFLRNEMGDTSPNSTKSRKWFSNHFLEPILFMAGHEQSKGTKNVAWRIFSQFFKTRDDFEWYFQTPLVDQQLPFGSLDISKSRDIYSVRYMGLASVVREIGVLKDNEKKERLMRMWFDLWIVSGEDGSCKFTVPISWILHCSGLYDQAPVVVKQMIEQFIRVGTESENQQQEGFLGMLSERSFKDRMMELVLLSDTPEPDSLFDLFLKVACNKPDASEHIITSIVNMLMEVEVDLEIKTMNEFTIKQAIKIEEQPRNKNRKNAMKKAKQKIELEESLQKENHERYIEALRTLIQRILSFLLSFLNHTTLDTSIIKQQIKHKILHTPLFYETLGKLLKLTSQNEDLQKDIQTIVEIGMEYLGRQSSDKRMPQIVPKLFKGK